MSSYLQIAVLTALLGSAGCASGGTPAPESRAGGEASQASDLDAARYQTARSELVRELRNEGIEDERVLDAIGSVLRHEMVPRAQRRFAYENRPLPIGHRQTISQPYVVALMTQLAELREGEKVLEVGTGSGYQAAVLAELGVEVYSIEIVEPLGRRAAARLEQMGYADRVHTRIGDGYRGWPEEAPFDAIVITAAPPEIPEPLLEQLAVGGRMVVPVGEAHQQLFVIERTETGYDRQPNIAVRFVPMTGEAQSH